MSLVGALREATVLAIPCSVAGAVHIGVIRLGIMRRLSFLPIDFGLQIGHKRIFGDHKTFRGVVVMVVGVGTASVLLFPALFEIAGDGFLSGNATYSRCVLWGALLGLGCVLGELPNSFIKRRLGIRPGEQLVGWLGVVWWMLDQLDSIIGALTVSSLVWPLGVESIACVIGLGVLIHPLGDLAMMQLGLKRRSSKM